MSSIASLMSRLLGGFLLCSFLASCQSASIDEGMNFSSGPVPQTETLGEGAVDVSLLLPRSGQGETGAKARQQRDGAALAMSDLGSTELRLTIYDTGGTPETAAALTGQAISSGTKLILGPATEAELAAIVADIPSGERPPIIAFVAGSAQSGSGSYALLSDETDSAIEVAAYGIGAGKENILAFVAPGYSQNERTRLARGISQHGGNLLGVIEYSAPDDLTAANRVLLERADSILLFAGNDVPVKALPAIRATELLAADASLLGTSEWPRRYHENPIFTGVYLPLLDQSGLRAVGERMQSAYGRQLTSDAAYAYDAIALAAGIVRTVGPEGLTENTLRQASGFRGATGPFRFESNGTVVRPFAIYRLTARSLQMLDPAPEGF